MKLTWKRWNSFICSSDVQNVLSDLLIVQFCQSGNGASSWIHLKLWVRIHYIEQLILHFSISAWVQICCWYFAHFLIDTLGMEKVQHWLRKKTVTCVCGECESNGCSPSRWQTRSPLITLAGSDCQNFKFHAVKCNLTELTAKSACVPLVASSVDTYAHVLEFYVLVDCSIA